jgi:Ca2+-binding RTX toxin-like protein
MPPTNRNDILTGTSGVDVIDALAGADAVSGGDGADTLSGGDGHDILNGGAGNDILYGHSAADTDPASGRITVTRIGGTIGGALFGTFAPNDPGILYVVGKNGDIVRLNTTTGATTTFMDLPASALSTAGEGGLLGLAFAPDYATSGKFYVHVNAPNGNVEVREYTRSASNPLVADLASARTIISVPHPTYANHQGGFIGFSPVDGYLYVSIGDGGSGGDPNNNAQNLNSLLGKILRLDVSSDAFPGDASRNYAIPATNPYAAGGGAPEIWASGLRNPWRASFDSNGDFYIADVGQDAREEVNWQPAGAGGRNYGWRLMEGTQPYLPIANPPTLTPPVYDYGHDVGISVIGGYVYCGPSPGLQGAYIFSDFNAGPYFSLRMVDGEAVDIIDHREQLTQPVGGLPTGGLTSFAVDANGRLYFMTFSGLVYAFDPSAAAGDGGDTLHGDDGDDRLYGGAGRDTLWGDAGADELHGGDANDILYFDQADTVVNGGAGTDYANAFQATGGVSVNLFTQQLEGVWGTSFADTFDARGVTVGTILNGFGGDDVLYTGLSYDRLSGGDGNDQLMFDSLDTLVDGGAGIDYANAFLSAVGVNVTLSAQNLEGVWGTAFTDILDAQGMTVGTILNGFGGNDILYTGSSYDRLSGGDGNDQLMFDNFDSLVDGGAGTDYANAYLSTQAVSVVLAAQNLEGVWGTQWGDNLDARGVNEGVILNGFGGNDVLYTGSSYDRLSGGDGNDQLMFDHLDTLVDGGAGVDYANAGLSTAGVTVSLAAQALEGVWGSGFADVIDARGVTQGVILKGFGGADTFYASGSYDLIDGGEGADIVIYAGNQSLYAITQTSPGVWTVVRDGVTDTITGVETLRFDSGDYLLG